ncbi:MAG: STAS domain-containing protein [Opitutae bacterium]|nr:STAS domain-containing protein [Opitutae bacterium]
MKYDFATFRGDVFGGITVAIVGLPLALAYGVVSGFGAVAGMYGAIAVGFFTAIFGGSRSLISGPTGPMSVAMAVIVTGHANSLAEAFTIAIMAGLVQVLLGVTKIGRFVVYTPYSVISGFMSGIGIIIILLQTLPFLGVTGASGPPASVVLDWPEALRNIDFNAFSIAAVTLLVGIFWPKRFRKYLPTTLAALIVGTLLSFLWLRGVPVIGEVPTGLPQPRLPDFSLSILARGIEPALIIGFLGAIDSLLSALIGDAMTRTSHNPNRVLIGQGLGNIFAGFIGGLPGAGSTTRTVVNIRAGGSTRVSGAIYAVIMLGIVLGLGRFVEAIPHAVLAGILIRVGWGIIDWRFITRIHRVQREHLVVMVVTLGLTVFLDLVTAVAIGLIAAGMTSARVLERLELDSVVSVPLLDQSFFSSKKEAPKVEDFSARVGLVALRGRFSVASSTKLIATISKDIGEHEVVIFDFTDTVYMDDSAALVVERLIEAAIDQKTECIVMGLSGLPAVTLRALNVLKRVPADRIVNKLSKAREIAQKILED